MAIKDRRGFPEKIILLKEKLSLPWKQQLFEEKEEIMYYFIGLFSKCLLAHGIDNVYRKYPSISFLQSEILFDCFGVQIRMKLCLVGNIFQVDFPQDRVFTKFFEKSDIDRFNTSALQYVNYFSP